MFGISIKEGNTAAIYIIHIPAERGYSNYLSWQTYSIIRNVGRAQKQNFAVGGIKPVLLPDVLYFLENFFGHITAVLVLPLIRIVKAGTVIQMRQGILIQAHRQNQHRSPSRNPRVKDPQYLFVSTGIRNLHIAPQKNGQI